MGYSEHAHAGGLSPTEDAYPAKAGGFPTLGWTSLSTVILLWVLFGIAALTSPGTLDDVWQWVNELPMALRIVVWVIGLPWLAGIAVLQGDLADGAKIAVVTGLALVTIWTFWPKRSG